MADIYSTYLGDDNQNRERQEVSQAIGDVRQQVAGVSNSIVRDGNTVTASVSAGTNTVPHNFGSSVSGAIVISQAQKGFVSVIEANNFNIVVDSDITGSVTFLIV